MGWFVAGKEQELMLKNTAGVAWATDSIIEHTASYLDPPDIRLRDSDFHQTDDVASSIEGSVADADYVDHWVTKTVNGHADDSTISNSHVKQRRAADSTDSIDQHSN